MKGRSCKILVEEIAEAIDKVERYTHGLTFEVFKDNDMAIDAVLRNLEVIGEASKGIPPEVREGYPDIPWKRMIGLRNIVIHEYFGIDVSIIWEIVTRNLPQTKPLITQMLKRI
ncbi:MAG: DUF86 domain-containing protein [candidate division WOR-3 bacterium]|uniref:DUF86 domain-containing protein n=1 Tax=candidate division TA06 bacterium B3_TA06 TaxID=2012487 RepID=A0A532VAJ4_UNCT6|nr:DUF86 domain-containing protein [candidate division WOR-3 bacterium]TET21792.1 MAG: DUF86 domain-containing protein [Candidatus Stahlbacteria bacterium]TKJ44225.1 MAG: hypothetical protein CEE36_00335 [candidate division TA06 bacterium B3_TA06]